MGMYDTLNGEQVKAFQWYSFDASDKRIGSAIVGHGGNLAYYSSKKHKDEYENWFTMTSADFSPFVVTDGFHTLFPTADETSLGTTRHFLSIYLPHLLQLIPSSYWTLACDAALSLTIA